MNCKQSKNEPIRYPREFLAEVKSSYPKWKKKNFQDLKKGHLDDMFYDYLKPDIIIGRILGWVFLKKENECYKAKLFSIEMLYAIFVYSGLSYLWCYVFTDLMEQIRLTKRGQLYIYSIFLFLHLLPIIMVAESIKISKLFTFWKRFQMEYIQITNNQLKIQVKKFRIIFFITQLVYIVLFSSLVMYHFQKNATIFGIFFGYYISLITNLSCVWYKSLHFLYGASEGIVNNINKIVSNEIEISISDVEPLWVNLSRLTKSTGKNFGFTICYYIMYLFLEVIVTTYETIRNFEISMMAEDIILLFVTIFVIFHLASIPFTAQVATNKIGEDFYKFLIDLKIKKNTKRFEDEIDSLLQVVIDNPPVIDLCGFVTLDNGLITSLMSTMVTYLIVLLQFKV